MMETLLMVMGVRRAASSKAAAMELFRPERPVTMETQSIRMSAPSSVSVLSVVTASFKQGSAAMMGT